MHTPMAQAAHRPSALRPGCVHSAVSWRASVPCHGRVAGLVVARTGHVMRARCRVADPPVTIQSLYSNTGPYRASCRAHYRACRSALAPCRRALGAVSQPLALCVATSGLPHTLAHGPTVSWPCWPCRGAVLQGLLVVSWPPYSMPLRLVSRYNPLYCDSDWKMGSSSSSLLPLLQKKNFHSLFFSFCSTYWKTIKNIYYYFFNFQ